MTTTTVARAWPVRRDDGLTIGFTDHNQRLAFTGVSCRPNRGMTARAPVQGTGLLVNNSEAFAAPNDDGINECDLMARRWD